MVKGRRVQGLRGLSEAWGAPLLKFPSPSESRPELGGRHRPLATRPFPFHAAQFPIQHPSSPRICNLHHLQFTRRLISLLNDAIWRQPSPTCDHRRCTCRRCRCPR